MDSTKGEHAIQIPGMDVAGEEHGVHDEPAAGPAIAPVCKRLLWLVVAGLVAAFVAVVVAGIVVGATDKPAEYSVAVAGLPGLDAAAPGVIAAAGGGAALPVVPALFNLTVRVRNPGRDSDECVPRGTTALVSYNGTVVGAGAVPAFCAARLGGEREVVAPVWSVGVVDALPPRTGQAAVGVAVRMPAGFDYKGYLFRVIDCISVDVGGGLFACKGSREAR
ncbi:hypothetical protein ACP70R_028788 [Stipagrostis hirtigluma subsp. patula]